MDQHRRLKGMAGSFVGHLVRRQPPQFLVNEREQFLGGIGVTRFDCLENLGDVARSSKGS